ncbi:MAG: tail fiber domain-containing protein, partial [Bacteroidia bacterium]|nr:tail fiber domain-containing protein [Bacteroidia bacterium]
ALDKIKKIQGVTYNYNLNEYSYLASGDTRTYLGFIAQEIKQVFPEAVAEKNLPVSGSKTLDKNFDPNSCKYETFTVVDYTAIVPVLVEAIKEQQAIIEVQKQELESLKQITNDLNNRIEKIEKK